MFCVIFILEETLINSKLKKDGAIKNNSSVLNVEYVHECSQKTHPYLVFHSPLGVLIYENLLQPLSQEALEVVKLTVNNTDVEVQWKGNLQDLVVISTLNS